MDVVIASNNAHKVEEIKNALDRDDWRFLTLKEAGIFSDPEEDGETFEENVLIKARAVRKIWNGCVLADDSGLEVDALGGAPGVLSARFAGAHGDDGANNAKLLECLEGVKEGDRTARFVCAMAFIDDKGVETVVRGTVEGKIGTVPSGDGGFGYDPLFYPDELGGTRSFAEISQDEKTSISHRGNALKLLKRALCE